MSQTRRFLRHDVVILGECKRGGIGTDSCDLSLTRPGRATPVKPRLKVLAGVALGTSAADHGWTCPVNLSTLAALVERIVSQAAHHPRQIMFDHIRDRSLEILSDFESQDPTPHYTTVCW